MSRSGWIDAVDRPAHPDSEPAFLGSYRHKGDMNERPEGVTVTRRLGGGRKAVWRDGRWVLTSDLMAGYHP